eukprot:10136174-Alexandrium_andersonii.AAC.1
MGIPFTGAKHSSGGGSTLPFQCHSKGSFVLTAVGSLTWAGPCSGLPQPLSRPPGKTGLRERRRRARRAGRPAAQCRGEQEGWAA